MQMCKIGWFMLTMCFGFAACAVDVPPQEPDAVGVNESALTEDGCPLPAPRMRGCRIPCKPCLIPECVDGQWTFERVEWDGCDSDPLPGPACCKASAWGGCPAECHCCDSN
ncbi:MAG TPA: hypothetical protein VMF89_17390 [Polyangiales bacterium]|nr:hypothetical protein [Polyangiales bacterium]